MRTPKITEASGQGTDAVQTTLTTYALGANLDNLTFIGAGAFDGTGNELDNVLTGRNGGDTLHGVDGMDTLNGGSGNDSLAGGADNDSPTAGRATIRWMAARATTRSRAEPEMTPMLSPRAMS